MKEEVIHINQVSKEYKTLNRKQGIIGSLKNLFSTDYIKIRAVSKIDLNVSNGEIVGFLGPNGSGKSTTIKIMTGILKQSSGTVIVNGFNPSKERTKLAKEVGVVFGQRTQLWWSLPVIESFNLIKEIYEVSDKDYYNNLKIFENMTEIKNLYNIPIRQLSLGQRMLCEILAAFIHDPKIVFLDEPTIGLDITTKQKIHNIILKINEIKNTTVILTTHDLSDVEAICDRVVILNKGEKIYDCTIEKLKKMFDKYRTIRLVTNEKSKIITQIDKLLDNKVIESVDYDGEWIEVIVDVEKQKVNEVFKLLSNSTINDISILNMSVENIIKRIYEEMYDDKE